MALGALLQRQLRHHHGVGADRAVHVDRHKHARPQLLLRVRHRGADHERARFLAERRIGEVDPAAIGIDLVARQDELDLVAVALGRGEQLLLDHLGERRRLVLRDAEGDPDRVQRGDVGQLGGFGRAADVGAFALQGAPRRPADRRADGRVVQVQLGLAQLGDRRMHGGLGHFEVADRAVEIGLRQGVLLGQRPDALERRLGRAQARLLRGQRTLRGVELRLERLGIDLEEQLPFLDEIALGVGDAVEEARHARQDFDLARAFRLRHEAGRVRHRARRHGDHPDLGRRRRDGRLVGRAGGHQDKRNKGERAQHWNHDDLR